MYKTAQDDETTLFECSYVLQYLLGQEDFFFTENSIIDDVERCERKVKRLTYTKKPRNLYNNNRIISIKDSTNVIATS